MQHPDYPIWTLLGFFIVLLPSPWHWRARNVATLSLIFWIALSNAVLFINSLIWADNFADVAPVWCDISGRIIQLMGYAVPICSLAQMRRLEQVASTRRTVITASERTRRMWIEGVMCLVFPPLMLPLLYVVQGHRYDIVESIGCAVPPFITWPGIAVKLLVPIVISIAVLVYSALAVRWFLVRRLQFRAILASSHTGLSVSRYLRLIALAVAEIVILLTNDLIGLIVVTLDSQIRPYGSFKEVHLDFGTVSQFPDGQQSQSTNFVNVIALYASPLYALVFFVFFGLGEEAITEYVAVWSKFIGFFACLGSRRKIARPVTPPPSVPSLGSKMVSASGRPFDEENALGTLAFDDKEEFASESGSPTGVWHRDRGIPMTIERSVV